MMKLCRLFATAAVLCGLAAPGFAEEPKVIGWDDLAPAPIEYDNPFYRQVLSQFEPDPQGILPISDDTLAALQRAMLGVVREARVVRNLESTAYRRFLGLNVDLAGKTGTAETGDFTDPHAWFAGYTFEEREDLPDIAVVVLLENQGEGSEWGAPVFRRIIESYFGGQPVSRYPWEARIRVPATPEPEEEPTEEG